jgi:hypothetical protein
MCDTNFTITILNLNKMKKIINSAIAFILIIGLICCNKNAPSGANIIRYKVNGKQVEINGAYNPLTKLGLSYVENPSPYNSIGLGGNNSKNRVIVSIKNGYSINTNINSDSIHSLAIYLDNNEANSNDGSALIKINIDNNNFISGEFSGTVYYFFTSTHSGDSLKITEGYFDIAKQ